MPVLTPEVVSMTTLVRDANKLITMKAVTRETPPRLTAIKPKIPVEMNITPHQISSKIENVLATYMFRGKQIKQNNPIDICRIDIIFTGVCISWGCLLLFPTQQNALLQMQASVSETKPPMNPMMMCRL